MHPLSGRYRTKRTQKALNNDRLVISWFFYFLVRASGDIGPNGPKCAKQRPFSYILVFLFSGPRPG